MATELKSVSELLDLFVDAVQDEAPDLTDFNDGSKLDTIAGVVAYAASEINRVTVSEFNKTFLETAHGPEVTGGPDDLQTLAVDHFGANLARPGAEKAVGIVAFSRPTADAGACLIEAGTIVKTQPNASGVAQRFETLTDVTLGVGVLTINASVRAMIAGTDGNVEAEEINEIETALTDDTVTVENADACSGGEAAEDDSTYRETIRNKITAAKGATLAALKSTAKTVPGVENAEAIESEQVVIEYDIATAAPAVGAEYFRIPHVVLYIADANGTANDALVAAVREAILPVRAAGVRVDIGAAVALELDWTAAITLNPAGPNYADLSGDSSPIVETMLQYLRDLPIGADFVKATADAAILAIWGPSGTNDLTDFVTSIPSGNVSVGAIQKVIPGDVEVV